MPPLIEQVVDELEKSGVSQMKTKSAERWRLRLRVEIVYGVRVEMGLRRRCNQVSQGTVGVSCRCRHGLDLRSPVL